MDLAELRKARGFTQAQIAAVMGVSQARVSAIENQALGSTEVGILARHIEALGGELRLLVTFPDALHEIRITSGHGR
jgi:transcriptional regulator with XRE-family HTH domain